MAGGNWAKAVDILVARTKAALGGLVDAHDQQPPMLTNAEWDAARLALKGRK